MPKEENPAPAPAAEPTPAPEAPAEAPAEPASAEEAPAEEAPKQVDPAMESAMDSLIENDTPAEAPAEAPAPAAEPTPAPEASAETPEAPAEPAPAAPAAEQPTPAAEPIVAAAPAAPVTAAAPAAKKSKKGLIIGLAAGVALIGGGSAFAIYKTNPDVAAVEAISNFISADKFSYTMSTEMLPTDEDDTSGIDSIKLTTNGLYDWNGEIKSEVNFDLTVKPSKYDEITVSLGSAVVKDYTAYIKVDNLKEAFKSVKKILEKNDVDISDYEKLIDKIINKIDGVWWKINIDDLLDSLNVDKDEAEKAKKAFTCVTSAVDREVAKKSKYADVYKNHKFFELKASENKAANSKLKGTVYAVKINGEELAGFYNEARNIVDIKAVGNCLADADIIDKSDVEDAELKEVKVSDVVDAIKDIPEFYVGVEGFFSHNLTGFYIPTDGEDSQFTGDIVLTFDYSGKFTPTLNTGAAKNPEELFEDIEEIVEEYQKQMYSSYYYGGSGTYRYDIDYNMYDDDDDDVYYIYDDDDEIEI